MTSSTLLTTSMEMFHLMRKLMPALYISHPSTKKLCPQPRRLSAYVTPGQLLPRTTPPHLMKSVFFLHHPHMLYRGFQSPHLRGSAYILTKMSSMLLSNGGWVWTHYMVPPNSFPDTLGHHPVTCKRTTSHHNKLR